MTYEKKVNKAIGELGDALYNNMRKNWPLWVVIGSVEDSEGNYAPRTMEVPAKNGIDARITFHVEIGDQDATYSFIEAVYGPYRKDE